MKVSTLSRYAIALAFVLFGAGLLLNLGAQQKPSSLGGYHLLKTIPLPPAAGGGEYYDYIVVDPETRRVYVSHGTEVVVLNADDYSVVGKLGPFIRCHGIALVKELNKGFITDGDPKTSPDVQKVWVFDMKALKVTGEIVTKQADTDAIIYEPFTKHIFTFNGDSTTTTVIDPVKETVITNIKVSSGSIQFPAVDGKGMVYDNAQEENVVVAIDARTNTVKDKWPVAPAGQPVAMAMDQKTRRLFFTGRDPQIMGMMNADTGKIIQTFPVSNYVDANAFDPGTGLVFVSTREGKIHIFHEDSPDKLSEVETVDSEYGGKVIQVDPKTHKLFVSASDYEPAPAPTEKVPHPWKVKAKPGNFRVLVFGR
jgi:DNA-binding beta-propeller fold protein YncE